MFFNAITSLRVLMEEKKSRRFEEQDVQFSMARPTYSFLTPYESHETYLSDCKKMGRVFVNCCSRFFPKSRANSI